MGSDGSLKLEVPLVIAQQRIPLDVPVACVNVLVAVQAQPLLEGEAGVAVVVLVFAQVEEVARRANADADRSGSGGQRLGDVGFNRLGGLFGGIGRLVVLIAVFPVPVPIDEGRAVLRRDKGLYRLGKVGIVEILAGSELVVGVF